jgi:hypothetical protein
MRHFDDGLLRVAVKVRCKRNNAIAQGGDLESGICLLVGCEMREVCLRTIECFCFGLFASAILDSFGNRSEKVLTL